MRTWEHLLHHQLHKSKSELSVELVVRWMWWEFANTDEPNYVDVGASFLVGWEKHQLCEGKYDCGSCGQKSQMLGTWKALHLRMWCFTTTVTQRLSGSDVFLVKKSYQWIFACEKKIMKDDWAHQQSHRMWCHADGKLQTHHFNEVGTKHWVVFGLLRYSSNCLLRQLRMELQIQTTLSHPDIIRDIINVEKNTHHSVSGAERHNASFESLYGGDF